MNQAYQDLKLSITHQQSIGPQTLFFIEKPNVINCIDEGKRERWKVMHTDAAATLVQC